MMCYSSMNLLFNCLLYNYLHQNCLTSNFVRNYIRFAISAGQHCVSFGVAGKLFVFTHKLQFTSEAIGDIGQMRKS